MKDVSFKIHATGEVVNVSSISFQEMEDLYGKGAAMPLIAACGFATMFVTESQIDECRKIYEGNEAAISAIEQGRPGHAVTILSDVDELMTDEDKTAVFLHELGHVVNRHIKNAVEGKVQVKTITVKGCGLVQDDDIEIEADAYAAGFVGYHRLLGALNAAVLASAKDISRLTNKATFEEIYEGIVGELRASARYQELLKYTEGY